MISFYPSRITGYILEICFFKSFQIFYSSLNANIILNSYQETLSSMNHLMHQLRIKPSYQKKIITTTTTTNQLQPIKIHRVMLQLHEVIFTLTKLRQKYSTTVTLPFGVFSKFPTRKEICGGRLKLFLLSRLIVSAMQNSSSVRQSTSVIPNHNWHLLMGSTISFFPFCQNFFKDHFKVQNCFPCCILGWHCAFHNVFDYIYSSYCELFFMSFQLNRAVEFDVLVLNFLIF